MLRSKYFPLTLTSCLILWSLFGSRHKTLIILLLMSGSTLTEALLIIGRRFKINKLMSMPKDILSSRHRRHFKWMRGSFRLVTGHEGSIIIVCHSWLLIILYCDILVWWFDGRGVHVWMAHSWKDVGGGLIFNNADLLFLFCA